MKIYTGAGDRGTTSLFSGQRTSKADERIEAYGDIDELNSAIGALIAGLGPAYPEIVAELRIIQSDLFAIGALLATTPDSAAMDTVAAIEQQHVDTLEACIDRMDAELPPLKGFILPGGHPAAAWAHVARTICRRAERRIVAFLDASYEKQMPDAYGQLLVYVNRLSDYLFVLARYCNHLFDIAEELWQP